MSDASILAATATDQKFVRNLVTVMAAVLVSGFVAQIVLGRSSFDAPAVVHAHAAVFMGWVGIVLTQVWLAGSGLIAVHKHVGKLAALWAVGLLVLGPWVTVAAVQTGRTPFFFQPQHFLIVDPLTVFAAVGLLGAAYVMRKQTAWHARLQVGSFSLLLGPGIGRLLPLPLLAPYAFEIAALAALVFPVIGIVYDWRTRGRPHPAWYWGAAVLSGPIVLARVIGVSPIGDAVFAAVVEGTSLAGSSGLAFPPPPGPPPVS